jgi:hypothetical protein
MYLGARRFAHFRRCVGVVCFIESGGTMKTAARRIAFAVLICIILFVVGSAVAIWLGLGPTVHSALV